MFFCLFLSWRENKNHGILKTFTFLCVYNLCHSQVGNCLFSFFLSSLRVFGIMITNKSCWKKWSLGWKMKLLQIEVVVETVQLPDVDWQMNTKSRELLDLPTELPYLHSILRLTSQEKSVGKECLVLEVEKGFGSLPDWWLPCQPQTKCEVCWQREESCHWNDDEMMEEMGEDEEQKDVTGGERHDDGCDDDYEVDANEEMKEIQKVFDCFVRIERQSLSQRRIRSQRQEILIFSVSWLQVPLHSFPDDVSSHPRPLQCRRCHCRHRHLEVFFRETKISRHHSSLQRHHLPHLLHIDSWETRSSCFLSSISSSH